MMWLLLRIVLPATVLTSISPNANMYTWLYHVKEYQQLQSPQYFWTVYGWAVEHIVSSDLSWSNHISSICGKAKKILGLLYRQYYNHVEEDVLKQLYISLKLSDHTWNTVELSGMLHTLNISNLHVKWHQSTAWDAGYKDLVGLPPLEQRRNYLKLCLLFKITHGLCHFPTGILTPRQIPHNFRMNCISHLCELWCFSVLLAPFPYGTHFTLNRLLVHILSSSLTLVRNVYVLVLLSLRWL